MNISHPPGPHGTHWLSRAGILSDFQRNMNVVVCLQHELRRLRGKTSLKLQHPTDFFQNNMVAHHHQAEPKRASHPWPACCCRTSLRSWRASSRTPTWTGSTGRPPSPTPGSVRPRHPGTGREKRTPVRPTSGASAPTPGPPLCRSRKKP